MLSCDGPTLSNHTSLCLFPCGFGFVPCALSFLVLCFVAMDLRRFLILCAALFHMLLIRSCKHGIYSQNVCADVFSFLSFVFSHGLRWYGLTVKYCR